MDYNIDEIVSNLDFNSNSLNCLSTGLLLTNNEIEVLNKYNINYNMCNNLKEVLALIEEVFNNIEFDNLSDLDFVSASIAERDYYQNSNK